MKKNLVINIFLSAITIILGIAILVLVTQRIVRKQAPSISQYFTSLDWDDKPINDIPSKSNMVREKKARGTGRLFTVRINSQGFRDYEYEVDRLTNTIRIAAVGDSITFGEGVDLEDTYVKQLEEILNDYCSNKIEVLNFGASGASTINELELIQKKVLLYKPDILLLQMDPNDAQVIHQIRKVDPFLDKFIVNLKKSDLDIARWLKFKLEFYKYYKYRKSLTEEDEYNNVIVPLAEIIGICRENNIKLVVVSYDPVYRGSYYDKVLDFVRGQHLPLLDLSKTIFGRLPYRKKYVNGELDINGIPVDAHPSKYGGRVMAEVIRDFFKTIPEFINHCQQAAKL